MSIARNTHVERGRPVTVDEIRQYRLPMHEACRQLRGLTHIVRTESGERRGVPCKCAHKRFMKAHPEVIIDATGAAWWPKEEAVAEQ